MPSNISLSNRPQQGITDRMDQNIRVRMAFQPKEVRDSDPSQDQRSARDERMDIITKTHSHLPFSPPRAPSLERVFIFRKRLANTKSSGVVILIFVWDPGRMWTFTPNRSTREASSVPTNPSAVARL